MKIDTITNEFSIIEHDLKSNKEAESSGPVLPSFQAQPSIQPSSLSVSTQFLFACAHGKMINVMQLLNRSELNSTDLNEGFRIAASFNHSEILRILKNHPLFKPKEQLKELSKNYNFNGAEIVKLLIDHPKVTPKIVNKIFIRSCKYTNIGIAKILKERVNSSSLIEGFLWVCQSQNIELFKIMWEEHFKLLKPVFDKRCTEDFDFRGKAFVLTWLAGYTNLSMSLKKLNVLKKYIHQAFLSACGMGQIQDLSLLENDLNKQVYRKAILKAFEFGKHAVVGRLISSSKLPTELPALLLMWAIEKGDSNMVKAVVDDKRIDTHQRDLCLNFAWEIECQEIAELLIAKGARLTLPISEPTSTIEHPLNNVPQKGKDSLTMNDTPDHGTYVHNFGKGLVKGGNLCFRSVAAYESDPQKPIKAPPILELSFKLNRCFRERVGRLIKALQQLSLDDQQH